MSDMIDIAMVFDTAGIQSKFPLNQGNSATNPQGISHPAGAAKDQIIFMVANATYLTDPNTQATANLSVNGYPEDVIRWRAESLSGQDTDSVVIYRLEYFSGDSSVASPPAQNVALMAHPVPNQDNPLNYTKEDVNTAFWQATLRKPGVVQYKVYFYILHYSRGTFTNKGYWWWDPTITVNSP